MMYKEIQTEAEDRDCEIAFGERAFSHTGPSAWNRLPEVIRAELASLTFENFLKLTILILRLTFNNCILSFYL